MSNNRRYFEYVGQDGFVAFNRVPITKETHEKFRVVSLTHRRSMSAEIAILVESAVEEFEDEYGEIILPEGKQ